MRKRWIFTGLAGLLICATSWGQQDPQLTQYMFDRVSINPAAAGAGGNICITGFGRQQWTGFAGAPKTGLLNVHGLIAKYNLGVGLTAYRDRLGQESSTIVRGHVAYHFKNVGGGTLSVGAYGGLTGRSLDGDWIAVDPVAGDPSIPDNGGSQSGFDLGAGLYYTTKKVWVGISSTQLPESELIDVGIQNARHYYLQAGYRHALGGDPNSVLIPSTLIKTDASSTQFDLSVRYLYKNQAWFGVSYRSEDAIAPMIGYQRVNDNGHGLRIGYSYDVTTSEIRNYSSGSHEIMLGYCFKIEKPIPVFEYRNPRYL